MAPRSTTPFMKYTSIMAAYISIAIYTLYNAIAVFATFKVTNIANY